MRKVYISFCLVLCGVLLLAAMGGCAAVKKKPQKDDDQLSWALQPEPPASNGAIYQVGRDVALFENPVARHIGDTVTIVLSESTAAKKSATTNTAKATNQTLPGVSLLGKSVTIKGNSVLSAD